MSGAGPALGPLAGLIGYRMRRASAVIGADFARAMAGTGLRQVPFAILAIVGANPGIRQGAVGELLGVQRANMVSLVNDLAEAGLLTRTVAADDRRAFALTLTDAGRTGVADGLERLRAHEDALLADLSAAERDVLTDLLSRIAGRDRQLVES